MTRTQSAARFSLDAIPGASLLIPSSTSRLARSATSARVEGVPDEDGAGSAVTDARLRIGAGEVPGEDDEGGFDEAGFSPLGGAEEISRAARSRLDEGGVVSQEELAFMMTTIGRGVGAS